MNHTALTRALLEPGYHLAFRGPLYGQTRPSSPSATPPLLRSFEELRALIRASFDTLQGNLLSVGFDSKDGFTHFMRKYVDLKSDSVSIFRSTAERDELKFDSMVVEHAPYKLIVFDRATYQYVGLPRLVWNAIFAALVPNGVVVLRNAFVAGEREARDKKYSELRRFTPIPEAFHVAGRPYVSVTYKEQTFRFPFNESSRSFAAYLKSAGVPKEKIFSSRGDLQYGLICESRPVRELNDKIANHTLIDMDTLKLTTTTQSKTNTCHIFLKLGGGDHHEHNFHVGDLQFDPRFRVYYDEEGTCVVVKEAPQEITMNVTCRGNSPQSGRGENFQVVLDKGDTVEHFKELLVVAGRCDAPITTHPVDVKVSDHDNQLLDDSDFFETNMNLNVHVTPDAQ